MPQATTAPAHASLRSALPARVRLLWMSATEPNWPLLTLKLEMGGCTDPVLFWCEQGAKALETLRKDPIDAFLVAVPASAEVIAVVEAARATGYDDAILILLDSGGATNAASDRCLAELAELECELLYATHALESPAFTPWLARAVERSRHSRESRQLQQAATQRTRRDRDEAERLLQQQRELLRQLCSSDRGDDLETPVAAASPPSPVRDRFSRLYGELLRTYVMMGEGHLSADIRQIAQLLALADLSPREAMNLHLQHVEQLVQGLGQRSSRHVMDRADVLGLELMIHLAEEYQRKSRPGGIGDYGIDLMHERARRERRAA